MWIQIMKSTSIWTVTMNLQMPSYIIQHAHFNQDNEQALPPQIFCSAEDIYQHRMPECNFPVALLLQISLLYLEAVATFCTKYKHNKIT